MEILHSIFIFWKDHTVASETGEFYVSFCPMMDHSPKIRFIPYMSCESII
jgi:hypothetical protein